MRHVNTRLLHVFVLLMEYRDVNAVALCIGARRATVAYSLDRLRDITGDALFARRNGVMAPTSRAIQLEPIVRRLLEHWSALVPQQPPEPPLHAGADADGPLTIGMAPSMGDQVMARILMLLVRKYPRRRFVAKHVQAEPAALAQDLSRGELDCAFVVDIPHMPEQIAFHHICAARRLLVCGSRPEIADHPSLVHDWILLAEDAAMDSPMGNFLKGQAQRGAYRQTIVPSWQSQMTLLLGAGGICPMLDFNFDASMETARARRLPLPPGFPAWAAVHFWTTARTAHHALMQAVRDAGKEVLGVLGAGRCGRPSHAGAESRRELRLA
ncbi:LysR substrate-binding domain-containing protein [Paracidovorax citrulli]